MMRTSEPPHEQAKASTIGEGTHRTGRNSSFQIFSHLDASSSHLIGSTMLNLYLVNSVGLGAGQIYSVRARHIAAELF
jgi:hypothetical protein